MLISCSSTPLNPVEEQKKQAELNQRCNKLKKEMDSLRGKPVRRNAAIEYYNSQCNVPAGSNQPQ